MNILGTAKRATKHFFHDETMFFNLLPRHTDYSIPFPINAGTHTSTQTTKRPDVSKSTLTFVVHVAHARRRSNVFATFNTTRTSVFNDHAVNAAKRACLF